jgi:hypothetical protein
LTATERTTGFLLVRKLKEGKNAKAIARELVETPISRVNFYINKNVAFIT